MGFETIMLCLKAMRSCQKQTRSVINQLWMLFNLSLIELRSTLDLPVLVRGHSHFVNAKEGRAFLQTHLLDFKKKIDTYGFDLI